MDLPPLPFSGLAITIALNMATIMVIIEPALRPLSRRIAWTSGLILSAAILMLAYNVATYLTVYFLKG